MGWDGVQTRNLLYITVQKCGKKWHFWLTKEKPWSFCTISKDKLVFQEILPPMHMGIRVAFRSLRSRTFHHPDKQEFGPARALAEHCNVVAVPCGQAYSLWG